MSSSADGGERVLLEPYPKLRLEDVPSFVSTNPTCFIVFLNEKASCPPAAIIDTINIPCVQLIIIEEIPWTVVNLKGLLGADFPYMTVSLYVQGDVVTRDFFGLYAEQMTAARSAFLKCYPEGGIDYWSKIYLCSGKNMLRDAVEDAGGLYIGLWDGSDVEGSLCILKRIHDLLSTGHSCGIYLDLKHVPPPPSICGKPKVYRLDHDLQEDGSSASDNKPTGDELATDADNLRRFHAWCLMDMTLMAGIKILRDSGPSWEEFVEANPTCYVAYFERNTALGSKIHDALVALMRSGKKCGYFMQGCVQLPPGYKPEPRIWHYLNGTLVDDDNQGYNAQYRNLGSTLKFLVPFTQRFRIPLPKIGRYFRQDFQTAASYAKPANAITVGKYEFVESDFLGAGTFGDVFRGRRKDAELMVAIKKIKTSSVALIQRELETMEVWTGATRHANLLLMLDHYTINGDVYCVTELCIPGDLKTYLERTVKCLSVPVIRHFTRQIVTALLFLVEKGIVHRDIKPANILLHDVGKRHDAPPLNLRLKLADFGYARFVSAIDDRQKMSSVGSEAYMAPEVLLGRKYGYHADLWSVGVVLYECAERKHPIECSGVELQRYYKEVLAQTNITQYQDLTAKGYMAFSESTPHSLRDLVCCLLRVPAFLRINLADFALHPFVYGADDELNLLPSDQPHESTLLCSLGSGVKLGQCFDINTSSPCGSYDTFEDELPRRCEEVNIESRTAWFLHSSESSRFELLQMVGDKRSSTRCELDILANLQPSRGYGKYFTDPELRGKPCLACMYICTHRTEYLQEDSPASRAAILKRLYHGRTFLLRAATHVVSAAIYGFVCIVAITLEMKPGPPHEVTEYFLKEVGMKLNDTGTVDYPFLMVYTANDITYSIPRDSIRIRLYTDPNVTLNNPTIQNLPSFMSFLTTCGPSLAKELSAEKQGVHCFTLTPLLQFVPRKLHSLNMQEASVEIDDARSEKLISLLRQLIEDEVRYTKIAELTDDSEIRNTTPQYVTRTVREAALCSLRCTVRLRLTVAEEITNVRRGAVRPTILDMLSELRNVLIEVMCCRGIPSVVAKYVDNHAKLNRDSRPLSGQRSDESLDLSEDSRKTAPSLADDELLSELFRIATLDTVPDEEDLPSTSSGRRSGE